MGHAVVPLGPAPEDGGLPVAFLRRLALQHSAAVTEALALVGEHDAWRAGDNLLFLDRGGEAAVVEMRPGAQRVRRPAGDVLWCTNCFVHPEMAAGGAEARQWMAICSFFLPGTGGSGLVERCFLRWPPSTNEGTNTRMGRWGVGVLAFYSWTALRTLFLPGASISGLMERSPRRGLIRPAMEAPGFRL